MKKLIAALLALSCLFAFAACNQTPAETTPSTTTPATTPSTEPTTEPVVTEPVVTEPVVTEPAVVVMTYDEYAAAAMDAPVVVEFYVQATQSWWNNQIVVYGQDETAATWPTTWPALRKTLPSWFPAPRSA